MEIRDWQNEVPKKVRARAASCSYEIGWVQPMRPGPVSRAGRAAMPFASPHHSKLQASRGRNTRCTT
jgi:hypothetical protein